MFDIFDQFFLNVVNAEECDIFFVTLIPKVDSPMGLGDYRSISPLSSLYKLVAKVLTARLTGVKGNLIYFE